MKLARLYLLKEHLNIHDDSNEIALRQYLDAAEDYVRSYCNREFNYNNYAEVLVLPPDSGLKSVTVFPKEQPLDTILNVEIDGEIISDYKVIDDAVVIDATKYNPNYVIVTYKGGYYSPDDANEPRVPSDLEQAVIYIASIMYNEKALGIGRQAVNTESGSFTINFQQIPEYIKNILDKYRASDV